MMKFLFFSILVSSLLLASCSGGKNTNQSAQRRDTAARRAPREVVYRLYLKASGSTTTPHDEFWIDTSGQMRYNTQQRMHNGKWESPTGLAFLEPKDEDTMLYFVKKDVLYSVDENDVTPQCAEGDVYTLTLYRSDLAKKLSIHTNQCAVEYNLLTGEQRKLFPAFLAFLSRIRERYRPGFTD